VEGKASYAAIYNDDVTFSVTTSKGIKIVETLDK